MESSKLVKMAAAAAAAGQQQFPPEIISEFLLRLPVRILCKLCCVSKQWHALITDPIFRASYRSRSKQNPPRILLKYGSGDRIAFSSLDMDRKLDPIGGFEFIRETPYAVSGLHTVCPLRTVTCLDLVCLYDRLNIFIRNPATGEHMYIPNPYAAGEHSQLPEEYRFIPSSCYRQEVAFGYLASTAEYKLLHIRTQVLDIDKTCCKILTLGSDQQWKRTKGPPRASYRYGVATCFRGAVYLVRSDRNVVRFDLDREEWTSIEGPKPDDLKMRLYTMVWLTELGGSLCLTDWDMHLGTAIWFLEDYNKGSWVCKYNIDVSPLCAGVHNVVAPLLIEKDGRVLLHIHRTNTLYYYEPRSKSFEKVYIYFGREILEASVYIESFKSLKFEVMFRRRGGDDPV